MLKSVNDLRRYRHLKLANGMRVVLVEDQHCRKSAAALTVGSGHFDDPADICGMGHLLEHGLFLGCQQFNQPNHFNDFLSHHGGYLNAWTGTESSCFYFDIASTHMDEAVEQFAAMLLAPLFDKAHIEKEIQAIDAEFSLKINDDLRRLYQVHKQTCNPAHPFSQFAVGNAQTLTHYPVEQLCNKLHQRHQQFFVGGNLTLCLISNVTIDQLQQMAERCFNGFPSGFVERPPYPPLYRPQDKACLINIQPVNQAQRLIVTFTFDGMHGTYPSKPLAIISYILGDEGRHSLLCYLRQKNWVTNLTAGGGIQGQNFRDFNINMQLTEQGSQHITDIVEALFYHIGQIRQQGLPLWRFAEKQRLHQLSFDFHEPVKSIDYAAFLANQALLHTREHLLCGDQLLLSYDPALFDDVIQHMRVDNMRIKHIAPGLPVNGKANWYNTPYQITPIPDSMRQRWEAPRKVADIQTPGQNPYIAARTTLVDLDDEYRQPQIIHSGQALKVWFSQDDQFRLPKGDIYLTFECTSATNNLADNTAKRLWLAALQQQFVHQYYQAELADLYFHLYPTQAGFTLHTSGFTDKQFVLFENLLTQLLDGHVEQPLFEQIKQKQWQATRNSMLTKPIQRLFNKLNILLQRHAFGPDQRQTAIEQCQYQDVSNIRHKLLNQYRCQAMIHGNWQLEQAFDFSHMLEQQCQPASPLEIMNSASAVMDLRPFKTCLMQVSNKAEETAILVYYQAPSLTAADTAKTMLTEQLLAAPFFNRLRQQQKLGYLVGSGYFPINQYPGMAFYVQSPGYDANAIYTHIQQFFTDIVSELDNYPRSRWEQLCAAMIKQLHEQDHNLTVKSQRLWMQIANLGDNVSNQQLVDEIHNLSINDIKCYIERILKLDGFGQAILYSQSESMTFNATPCYLIKDVESFKNRAQIIK